MAYRYTYDEWQELRKQREIEDRAQAEAYAQDMDVWSALREEQHRGETWDRESLATARGLGV